MKTKINGIQIGERLRALSDARVKQMALSIDANGLIHPVVLSGSILVCGWHRLEARRSLGWPEIPAEDIGLKDAEQRLLIEVEENLVRQDVSAVERCIMLKLHKEIYDGANPGASLPGRKNGLKPYARANPLELDIGPRRINQLIRIANEIPDLKRLAGTLLDDNRALDGLLLLKTKNADEFARVLAEPNGNCGRFSFGYRTPAGADYHHPMRSRNVSQPLADGAQRRNAGVDAILDNASEARETRWQKRALTTLNAFQTRTRMERIKELHGMVTNGATKRRSGQAKPSRV